MFFLMIEEKKPYSATVLRSVGSHEKGQLFQSGII